MSTSEYARAAVLGTLQGITEFLPISSDGHLAIARHFLGGTEAALGETVLLHLGTLLATALVLRSDIGRSLTGTLGAIRSRALDTDAAIEARNVVVASIPTAAIGLAMEPHVDAWSANLAIVGVCLGISAAFVGSSHRTRNGVAESLSLRGAILVGIIQGLAVLPGWSRSGSTIAAAMALGASPLAAFRFSFLLSLPAVAGACLLELRHPETWARFDGASYTGAVIAFVVGVGALSLLRTTLGTGRFAWFAPYLAILSIAVLGLYATSG